MRCLLLTTLLLAACATNRADDPAYRLTASLLQQHMAVKAWPEALTLAQEMVARDPEDFDALALRGVAAREVGLLAEARADLERAAEEQEESAWIFSELAMVYEKLREVAEAEGAHRKAIEIEPKNASLYNNLAFSLHARGRMKEAIESYRASLHLDPTSARVRNNLGFALAHEGDFSAAAAQFTLGGNDAEAKNNLGFAYELAGNLAQARALYVEALAIDPELARAKRNLVHIGQKLGISSEEAPAAAVSSQIESSSIVPSTLVPSSPGGQ